MDYDQQSLPTARQKDLLVEHLPDEVVVYDLRNHRVHCLNATASRAWELCDGKHNREQVAAALLQELLSNVVDQLEQAAVPSGGKSGILPSVGTI